MIGFEVMIPGTHGRRSNGADSFLLNGNYIAMDWAKVGNPGETRPSREAFRAPHRPRLIQNRRSNIYNVSVIAAIFISAFIFPYSLLHAAGNPPPFAWYTAIGEKKSYEDLVQIIRSKGSLSGAKLRGLPMEEFNMSGIDLSGSDFSGSDLSHCDLREAKLSRASLRAAWLSDSNLTRANLAEANLADGILQRANLKGAVLTNVNLSGAVFGSAHLEDVDLSSVIGLNSVNWGKGAYWNDNTKWPSHFAVPLNLNSFRGRLYLILSDWADEGAGLLGLSTASLALLTLLFILFTFQFTFQWRHERALLSEQETRIKELEQASDVSLQLLPFLENQLNLTIERERLTMLSANTRAQRLTSIGTLVLLLSLLAPVVSTLAYVWTTPSKGDLVAVQALIKDAKLSDDQLTQIAGRDWHVLLSGLSFGLLLLAAARGIMKQEQQQREIYFRLAQRVASFENMVSALRISERLEKEGQSWQLPSTLETIISRLLQPEPSAQPSTHEKEESQDPISSAVEALKSLR